MTVISLARRLLSNNAEDVNNSKSVWNIMGKQLRTDIFWISDLILQRTPKRKIDYASLTECDYEIEIENLDKDIEDMVKDDIMEKLTRKYNSFYTNRGYTSRMLSGQMDKLGRIVDILSDKLLLDTYNMVKSARLENKIVFKNNTKTN